MSDNLAEISGRDWPPLAKIILASKSHYQFCMRIDIFFNNWVNLAFALFVFLAQSFGCDGNVSSYTVQTNYQDDYAGGRIVNKSENLIFQTDLDLVRWTLLSE